MSNCVTIYGRVKQDYDHCAEFSNRRLNRHAAISVDDVASRWGPTRRGIFLRIEASARCFRGEY